MNATRVESADRLDKIRRLAVSTRLRGETGRGAYIHYARLVLTPDETVELAGVIEILAARVEELERLAGRSTLEPATEQARRQLVELRETMSGIHAPIPAYPPGLGPSAADNCRQLLEQIAYLLGMLTQYFG
jgi:hypothetical protein